MKGRQRKGSGQSGLRKHAATQATQARRHAAARRYARYVSTRSRIRLARTRCVLRVETQTGDT